MSGGHCSKRHSNAGNDGSANDDNGHGNANTSQNDNPSKSASSVVSTDASKGDNNPNTRENARLYT